jgi:tRNA(Ile)-lysidine synthase
VDPTADDFERHLAAAWPVAAWQDVTVVVAVSGGADSVALLRAMHALRSGGAGRLVVAHCNHRLRGAESDADAAFVGKLCRRLGVACNTGIVEVTDRGDGLEAAARASRYEFLGATGNRLGARYLATAHTADDQAETILHRILRGTGLTGLAGIPRVRPLTELTTLIRPLLGARRNDVLAYLARLGQDYREDSTNAQPAFTRNRLRHDLLPQLARDYNPNVVEALLRLGQLSGEAQEVLNALAAKLCDEAATRLPGGGWEIDVTLFRDRPRYLIREALIKLWQTSNWPQQAMGQAEWAALAELILSRSKGQRLTFPGNVQAERPGDGDTLTLCRSVSPPPAMGFMG